MGFAIGCCEKLVRRRVPLSERGVFPVLGRKVVSSSPLWDSFDSLVDIGNEKSCGVTLFGGVHRPVGYTRPEEVFFLP